MAFSLDKQPQKRIINYPNNSSLILSTPTAAFSPSAVGAAVALASESKKLKQ
jgi:hypothetical protein